MARLPDPQNIQGHRVSYSSEKKGTAIRIEIKEGKRKVNKKLKRALELCLGTCGGCSHFDIFKQYCDKKNEPCMGTNPACDDYKMWDMENRENEKHTWQHGCEYEVKESPSFSRFIDCPMQKTCEAYRDELYKQCPLNAHPIDYRPKGCPIEFEPSPN